MFSGQLFLGGIAEEIRVTELSHFGGTSCYSTSGRRQEPGSESPLQQFDFRLAQVLRVEV